MKTCSLVDVIRKIERDLVFNLYCRLDRDWNSANRDRGRCDGASNSLWDICYASNQNRAIRARDVGVKMWAIGRVSSLGLEVLLRRSDHGEAAFEFQVFEQGFDCYLCWQKAAMF